MAFSCEACSRSFHSSSALWQHGRDSDHGPLFDCDICDRSFSTNEALEQHCRDSPAHAPKFDCKLCDRSFSSDEALNQHRRDSPAHAPKFDCDICDRSFASLEALGQHVTASHAPSFDCIPCGRSFSTDTSLAQHLIDSPNHQSIPETPLDVFFSSFVNFDYDHSLPPATSYSRLQQHQRWKRGDAPSRDAWDRYQEALREELQMWFGEEDDLTAWHSLCRAIGISPPPRTCEQCEQAVRRTHVNIVDLIDWGRRGQNYSERVDTFETVSDLREYTRKTRKIFRNTFDEGEEGSNVVLRHLLRHIYRGRL